MQKRRIYLASSWRNVAQPEVVRLLREQGHEVYDFRNPAPGNDGFRWTDADPDANWRDVRGYITVIGDNPVARAGFALDKAALDWCDTCVLLLPCGRSAHLEAGYAIGQGKHVVIVLSEDGFEPELMYLLADAIVETTGDLMSYLQEADDRCVTVYF